MFKNISKQWSHIITKNSKQQKCPSHLEWHIHKVEHSIMKMNLMHIVLTKARTIYNILYLHKIEIFKTILHYLGLKA